MTYQEKKDFIQNYMEQMRNAFLSEVIEMPENWDGIELRWYIERAFAFESPPKDRARFRAFGNAISTLPLMY